MIEIALRTVKVRNWDNTITTVQSETCHRALSKLAPHAESGGRRIKRSLYFDQNSIGFLDQHDIVRLSQFRRLEHYLTSKRSEIAAWNQSICEMATIPTDTRRATNIGTFGAYVEAYLRGYIRACIRA